VQRALEVYLISGKTLTQHWAEQKIEPFPYKVVQFALCPLERKTLHERIEKRFNDMLAQGFIDEVKALQARGDLHENLPAIRAVGYRQVWEYLNGELSYDEMVFKGVVATRQLAKRQITWLRSWSDLHWLDSEADNLAQSALKIVESEAIVVA